MPVWHARRAVMGVTNAADSSSRHANSLALGVHDHALRPSERATRPGKRNGPDVDVSNRRKSKSLVNLLATTNRPSRICFVSVSLYY